MFFYSFGGPWQKTVGLVTSLDWRIFNAIVNQHCQTLFGWYQQPEQAVKMLYKWSGKSCS